MIVLPGGALICAVAYLIYARQKGKVPSLPKADTNTAAKSTDVVDTSAIDKLLHQGNVGFDYFGERLMKFFRPNRNRNNNNPPAQTPAQDTPAAPAQVVQADTPAEIPMEAAPDSFTGSKLFKSLKQ